MLIARILPGVLLSLAQASSAAAAQQVAPVVLRVNGVSLAMQWQVLEGAPEELARRLQDRWGTRLPSPGAASSARRLLGRQRGPFHETLTLSPGPRAGTALALVAVQDLRRRPAPLPPRPLTLPAAAQLLNVIEFGAPAGPATAWTFEVAGAADVVLKAIDTAAREAGWRQRIAPPLESRPQALWAQRAAQELAAVAIDSGARTRLVLLVTSPVAGAAP